MPRGGGHHGPAHAGAAGEEDAVEALAQKRFGSLALALNDRKVFLRKVRPDESCERSRGVGRDIPKA